jgi:hypothetical protein
MWDGRPKTDVSGIEGITVNSFYLDGRCQYWVK